MLRVLIGLVFVGGLGLLILLARGTALADQVVYEKSCTYINSKHMWYCGLRTYRACRKISNTKYQCLKKT